MIVTALFVLTGVLYAVSCALYLAYLAKGAERAGEWANRVLVASVLAHSQYFVFDFYEHGHIPFGDIHQTLSLASMIIVLAYLATKNRYNITVLGGFITPVTLLFFMGAGLGRSVGQVPPDVRSAVLPVHIGANVLGVSAFALAFAVALAYVIQERLLKRKQIGGLFQRLPALDVLDSLGFRLVTIGFPLLTVGIITGTVWAVRSDPTTPIINATQGFALLSWLVFAGVLLLRVAAGWRGRRAAIGTMVGFACAMAVLVGYVIESGGGT